jgi:hypothetical protein
MPPSHPPRTRWALRNGHSGTEQGLLAGKPGDPGRTGKDNRLFVNALGVLNEASARSPDGPTDLIAPNLLAVLAATPALAQDARTSQSMVCRFLPTNVYRSAQEPEEARAIYHPTNTVRYG